MLRRRREINEVTREGKREGGDFFLGKGSPHLVPIATQPSMKNGLVPPSLPLALSLMRTRTSFLSIYLSTHYRHMLVVNNTKLFLTRLCKIHQQIPQSKTFTTVTVRQHKMRKQDLYIYKQAVCLNIWR